jgi:FKBP12-rapamycin complex-associated protein
LFHFTTVPVYRLTCHCQLIARIHAPSSSVRKLIQIVLTDVGKAHPQALVYPLTVASKYPSPPRRRAALAIIDRMAEHSAALVEQAKLVSQELIRVAILWNEMWHEGLEEASRLYYGDGNVEAMFATLDPLHDLLEKVSRHTQNARTAANPLHT